MKKILIILVLFSILLLNGCQNKNIQDCEEVLTINEMEKLNTILTDKDYYFGTVTNFIAEFEGGYIVTTGNNLGPQYEQEVKIGEFIFYLGQQYNIAVIKGNKWYNLETAYNENIINDSQLSIIYNKNLMAIKNVDLSFDFIDNGYTNLVTIESIEYFFACNDDGSKIIVLKDTNGIYKWEELKDPYSILTNEEFNLLQKYIAILSR